MTRFLREARERWIEVYGGPPAWSTLPGDRRGVRVAPPAPGRRAHGRWGVRRCS